MTKGIGRFIRHALPGTNRRDRGEGAQAAKVQTLCLPELIGAVDFESKLLHARPHCLFRHATPGVVVGPFLCKTSFKCK